MTLAFGNGYNVLFQAFFSVCWSFEDALDVELQVAKCANNAREHLRQTSLAVHLVHFLSASDDHVLAVCCQQKMASTCWPPRAEDSVWTAAGDFASCCFFDLRAMLHAFGGPEAALAPWMLKRLDQDFAPYQQKRGWLREPRAKETAALLCYVRLPGTLTLPSDITFHGDCSGQWFEGFAAAVRIILRNVPSTIWPSGAFAFQVSMHHLGVPPLHADPDEYEPGDLGEIEPIEDNMIVGKRVGKAMATPQPGNWPDHLKTYMARQSMENSDLPPIFVFALLPSVRRGGVLIPAEIMGADETLAEAEEADAASGRPWESRLPKLFWRGSPGDFTSMTARVKAYLAEDNGTSPPYSVSAVKEKAIRLTLVREMRGRLVQISRRRPDLVEAKFNAAHGWGERHNLLERTLETLGLCEPDFRPVTDFLNFRFGAIMDGFSWARNTVRTMALDMVPFYARTGLQWWYYEGLRAWEHYVPLDTQMAAEEVHSKILWAKAEEERARQIAMTSSRFAHRWFSEKVQMAYLCAALLRYAALFPSSVGNRSTATSVP